MAISARMKQRIEAYVRELAEELGEVDDGDADSWLDAVETQAIEIGDAVTAELLKKQSVRRAAEDESTCPACGQTGRYRGPRQRELLTRRGPATIAEPEYYCPSCRRAFFPLDGGDRR